MYTYMYYLLSIRRWRIVLTNQISCELLLPPTPPHLITCYIRISTVPGICFKKAKHNLSAPETPVWIISLASHTNYKYIIMYKCIHVHILVQLTCMQVDSINRGSFSRISNSAI